MTLSNRALRALMFLLATSIASGTGEAKSVRDPEVRRAFMKLHPCPSTGKTKGACPGWQVDHIIPLCFYGVDATWNMGWKTVRDHREKTKLDVKVCTWDGK